MMLSCLERFQSQSPGNQRKDIALRMDDSGRAHLGRSGSDRRRHSIASTALHATDQRVLLSADSGISAVRPKRRQSIQESLQLFTKSMSNSLQKAIHFGGSTCSMTDEGKSRLTKTFFRDVLGAHFKQQDLKVTKVILRPIPNPHTNQVLHEAEVLIKDSRGRRKVDLLTKFAASEVKSGRSSRAGDAADHSHGSSSVEINSGWVLDGTNDEMARELASYETVVEDMWQYLRNEKGIADPEQFMCLPMRYKTSSAKSTLSHTITEASDSIQELNISEGDGGALDRVRDHRHADVLVIQNLFAYGYRSASQDRLDETGLDFNHSIMAITRLARFHAISYAMRKEKKMNFLSTYPFLKEDPVYRPETEVLFAKVQSSMVTRLQAIFQQSSHDLRTFSNIFLESVRNLHSIQTKFIQPSDTFGVLCHGDLWRQNVLFFYGSSLECQTDCLDVRFEDLHRSRYASCVTDLLYFLFTTVDLGVRRDHIMDFLAVYHDHFIKLFSEFRCLLMFGFLEGLCLFSTVYESQLRKAAEEDSQHPDGDTSVDGDFDPDSAGDQHHRPRYADYKEAVTAMMEDVIRLKLQGEAKD